MCYLLTVRITTNSDQNMYLFTSLTSLSQLYILSLWMQSSRFFQETTTRTRRTPEDNYSDFTRHTHPHQRVVIIHVLIINTVLSQITGHRVTCEIVQVKRFFFLGAGRGAGQHHTAVRYSTIMSTAKKLTAGYCDISSSSSRARLMMITE